jgi:hypothetical protein
MDTKNTKSQYTLTRSTMRFYLMSTGGGETQEDLERVITVAIVSYQGLLYPREEGKATYINHWKPVRVPSMTIRTGKPFHRPEKPMVP